MAKEIYYDDDARERVLAGAKALYDAVKVTMGPKGRNVVIDAPWGVTTTHDGVTVAKAVDIKQEYHDDENWGHATGAKMIKDAASKTNDNVGDGTTTSTVLAYHLLNEANRLIAAGHNPMDLKRGLDKATAKVLAALPALTEQIGTDPSKVESIATISAGDPEIGKLIGEVIAAVGQEGSVTVEQSAGLELEKEITEGFVIDRGYISQYMVTDQQRNEAVYGNPLVLITDKAIRAVTELAPLLNTLAEKQKKDLLIIAETVDGEALAFLVLNKLKGMYNAVAIQAPSFGENRRQILDDIALLTGATVISDDNGLDFKTATMSDLGKARKIVVGKAQTTIIGGEGDPDAISARLEGLRQQVEHETGDFAKDALMHRVASLAGKVALIKVGGATEQETDTRKYSVDDAVAATKAAMAEGIVPGGGVTLIELSKLLDMKGASVTNSEDAGALILKRALVQPFRELMTNAGLNPDEKLPQAFGAKPGYGFNVNDPDKLIDLKKGGVVDPAKVTREAIQNAVSVAGTAMTMGALMVDIPQPTPGITAHQAFEG